MSLACARGRDVDVINKPNAHAPCVPCVPGKHGHAVTTFTVYESMSYRNAHDMRGCHDNIAINQVCSPLQGHLQRPAAPGFTAVWFCLCFCFCLFVVVGTLLWWWSSLSFFLFLRLLLERRFSIRALKLLGEKRKSVAAVLPTAENYI